MKTYLAMVVGNNFEEIEMVASVDILRRAGIRIDIVSLYNQTTLVGAHQIKVLPDLSFTEFDANKYDGILIPGGKGVESGEQPLLTSDELVQRVQEFNQRQKLVGAICAAPQVLGRAGVLTKKKITHFPGSDQFLDDAASDLSQAAIIDKNIITGSSAGGAIQFALGVVEYFQGPEKKAALAQQLVVKNYY